MPRRPERDYKKRIPKFVTSVRVMRSFDYCHFEICLGTDQKINLEEANEMRKEAQRLADEAVRQYKKAKMQYSIMLNNGWRIDDLKKQALKITIISENDLTPDQKALLKIISDYDFAAGYDYQDDFAEEEF